MKQIVIYTEQQPSVVMFERENGVSDVILNAFVGTVEHEHDNVINNDNEDPVEDIEPMISYEYEVNVFKADSSIPKEYFINNIDSLIDLEIKDNEIYTITQKTKVQLINESKTKLADFLKQNPLLWKDNKYYSVTAEKQSLLTSQLSLHTVSAQAGETVELHWNSTCEECKVWEYSDLCELAMAIAVYVRPFVAIQQKYEMDVITAESDEEANKIILSFE